MADRPVRSRGRCWQGRLVVRRWGGRSARRHTAEEKHGTAARVNAACLPWWSIVQLECYGELGFLSRQHKMSEGDRGSRERGKSCHPPSAVGVRRKAGVCCSPPPQQHKGENKTGLRCRRDSLRLVRYAPTYRAQSAFSPSRHPAQWQKNKRIHGAP